MRTVVSVATGSPRFTGGLRRLEHSLNLQGEKLLMWDNEWPPNSPTHAEIPFGFKVASIEAALDRGYDVLLWCDSSIVPIAPLGPLWAYIEAHGYWLSRNYGFLNGEFTSDAALKIMGQTRDEAMMVPHVIATAFGLDMRQPVAQEWLGVVKSFMLNGTFANGGSDDPRFRGHRHDQSTMSFVCAEMGLTLTTPPTFIAEGGCPISDETTLVIERG